MNPQESEIFEEVAAERNRLRKEVEKLKSQLKHTRDQLPIALDALVDAKRSYEAETKRLAQARARKTAQRKARK